LLRHPLEDFGLAISAGPLRRIWTAGQEVFHPEKAAVLTAGLAVSSSIGTADPGARHPGHNGFGTVIGNDLFAYFASTDSKSRRNLLEVLPGGQPTYAIKETTLASWKRQELAAALVAKLSQGPQQFADAPAGQVRLAELAITTERHVRIAPEGALRGGWVARGVSPNLVVLSDGAPQFVVLVHAACWIHAERPLARRVPSNEEHRVVLAKSREQIGELYQGLKAYGAQPEAAQKPILEARFDALGDQRTGSPSSDNVRKEMREHQADLRRARERPEVPLHNHAEESDIREYVKKGKISGGTRSEQGRRCRDTFTSLKKTCRKLGVRCWDSVQDRVRGLGKIPRLADWIRARAQGIQAPRGEAVPV
jgi:Transposase IS66 family